MVFKVICRKEKIKEQRDKENAPVLLKQQAEKIKEQADEMERQNALITYLGMIVGEDLV